MNGIFKLTVIALVGTLGLTNVQAMLAALTLQVGLFVALFSGLILRPLAYQMASMGVPYSLRQRVYRGWVAGTLLSAVLLLMLSAMQVPLWPPFIVALLVGRLALGKSTWLPMRIKRLESMVEHTSVIRALSVTLTPRDILDPCRAYEGADRDPLKKKLALSVVRSAALANAFPAGLLVLLSTAASNAALRMVGRGDLDRLAAKLVSQVLLGVLTNYIMTFIVISMIFSGVLAQSVTSRPKMPEGQVLAANEELDTYRSCGSKWMELKFFALRYGALLIGLPIHLLVLFEDMSDLFESIQ